MLELLHIKQGQLTSTSSPLSHWNNNLIAGARLRPTSQVREKISDETAVTEDEGV